MRVTSPSIPSSSPSGTAISAGPATHTSAVVVAATSQSTDRFSRAAPGGREFDDGVGAATPVVIAAGQRGADVQHGDWWQTLKVPPRRLAMHTSQSAVVAGQSVQEWLNA